MANNVTFIIQLKDQFSRMSQKFNRTFDGMNRSAEDLNKQLKGFKKRGQEIRDLGGSFAKTGAVMTAAVTVPAALMGRSMINAASDAEETANKFAEVFKGIGSQSSAAVNELTSGFFLAKSSAQELLSNTGDLLVGLGLNREEALKLSADVVKLSADVASFKNVEGGTARAADALTKALLGEREMLKETFKTAVREEEVKKRAQILRIKDRKLTEQQAKALATLAIVTERNKDAIGDLTRTSESFANVERANSEAVKTLSESFGRLLLPFATKVLQTLTKLVNWVEQLSPGMKKFVLIVAGLAALAGPILLLLGGMAAAFSVLSLPILAVSAAVLGVVAVGALLVAKWDKISAYLAGSWEGMKLAASDASSWIADGFGAAWTSIKDGAVSAANFAIQALNGMLGPINLVREALGFEGLKIPTIELSAATVGALKPPAIEVPAGAFKAPVIQFPEIKPAAMVPPAAPTAPTSSVSGSLQGSIIVSAAPGARVESTSMQTAGKGLNMGLNMATAGP